jgi:hypothetical protein
MRRYVLAAATALTVLIAGALAPQSAHAMTLTTSAGIANAVDTTSLAQDVAYICRRVRVCGPYGCGWRRSCGYVGGPYYGPRRFYGGPRWRGGYRRW